MPSKFTSLTEERRDELVRFLLEVFKLEVVPEVWSPDVLRWKLFEPHPLWAGSRSYVLEADGAIAAHGTVAPLRYEVGERVVESMQIIDWAGGSRLPGAGTFIYRKCLSLCDTLLAVGGSPDTRRIIPQLPWFSRLADVRRFVRPLRPLRRLLAARPRDLRGVLKMARDLWWSVYPPLPDSGAWSCQGLESFSQVWTPRGAAYVPIQRSADWLNYLKRCPAVPFRAMSLIRAGRPAGHALVAFSAGTARLVDFVVDDEGTSSWAAALAALLRKVAERPDVVEIAARSSIPALDAVLRRCGFRQRGVVPAYLADPKKKLPRDVPLEINFLVGDAAYS